MRVGLVLIVAELLAFALLKAGVSVGSSLGGACCAAAVLLTWRSLLRFVRGMLLSISRLVRFMVSRLTDRRTWQFSLRTLFIVVLVWSCICAWYGHRLHKIRREQAFLNGQWRVVREDGSLAVLPDGSNILVTFDETTYTVDLNHEPRWLDFHSPGQRVSKAIYRREGERLRVLQVSSGCKRPDSFEMDISSLEFEPGTPPGGTYGLTEYLLERVPDSP